MIWQLLTQICWTNGILNRTKIHHHTLYALEAHDASIGFARTAGTNGKRLSEKELRKTTRVLSVQRKKEHKHVMKQNWQGVALWPTSHYCWILTTKRTIQKRQKTLHVQPVHMSIGSATFAITNGKQKSIIGQMVEAVQRARTKRYTSVTMIYLLPIPN